MANANIHTPAAAGWRHGFPKSTPFCDDCLAPIWAKPAHGRCLPCARAAGVYAK